MRSYRSRTAPWGRSRTIGDDGVAAETGPRVAQHMEWNLLDAGGHVADERQELQPTAFDRTEAARQPHRLSGDDRLADHIDLANRKQATVRTPRGSIEIEPDRVGSEFPGADRARPLRRSELLAEVAEGGPLQVGRAGDVGVEGRPVGAGQRRAGQADAARTVGGKPHGRRGREWDQGRQQVALDDVVLADKGSAGGEDHDAYSHPQAQQPAAPLPGGAA